MNKLILCEGESDAIFLSYYLKCVYNWKTCSAPQDINIKANGNNQSAYWYKRNDDLLLICGVGGKSNFGNFFADKILNPQKKSNAFQKIAIVTDRDNREIYSIQDSMNSKIHSCDFEPKFENRKWLSFTYKDNYGMEQSADSFLLVIPTDQEGALETLLLSAIASDDYDKIIVDSCKNFVDEIKPKAEKYISNDRLCLKAYLSTTWAIQSPEKMFRFINQQIESVEWEKYDILNECFKELCEI